MTLTKEQFGLLESVGFTVRQINTNQFKFGLLLKKNDSLKLAEMNDSLIVDNNHLRARVKALTKALDVMRDFASSVGGSSSFWDDYWPQFDPDNVR